MKKTLAAFFLGAAFAAHAGMVLNQTGVSLTVDCYEGMAKRSIIVLQGQIVPSKLSAGQHVVVNGLEIIGDNKHEVDRMARILASGKVVAITTSSGSMRIEGLDRQPSGEIKFNENVKPGRGCRDLSMGSGSTINIGGR